jgi:integrase/recombinase XerD
MTPSARRTTPLRQRIIEDMKIRNLSPDTIKAYVDRVAAFAKHFGRSAQLLGPKEVREYLVFLVEEKRVSWS